jgi:hypothetical protein
MSIPSHSGLYVESYDYSTTFSGDFDVQVDVDWTGMDVGLAANQYAQTVMEMDISSKLLNVLVGDFNDGWLVGTGYDFQQSADSPGSGTGGALSAGASDTLRIVRQGSTVTGYVNGNSNVYSGTYSGTATISLKTQVFGPGTSPSASCTFDNFTVNACSDFSSSSSSSP